MLQRAKVWLPLFYVWVLASSALAQEELDEPPAKTLADSERAHPPQRKSASLSDAPAQLSPKEADKKARDEFESGRVAWEDGDFRGAWEHWHLAYRLSRKPELLYNVGQAADRLRMDKEALEAFRMYLDKNPNATNRREVEQRIEILEKQVAMQSNRPEANSSLEARPDTLEERDIEPVNEYTPNETTDDMPSSGSAGDDEDEDGSSAGGQPKRSGWYARASAGFGLLGDAISDTAGNPYSLGAITLELEGAVGYGVLEKLVVGGMLGIDWALSPSVSQNGAPGMPLNSMSLLLVSAFADYYLKPQSHGFHIFGGLGFGRLAISGAALGNQDAGGGAIFAGAGYDIPLSAEWVLTLNGKLTVGRFTQDLFDHTLIMPSVSCGAVWY